MGAIFAKGSPVAEPCSVRVKGGSKGHSLKSHGSSVRGGVEKENIELNFLESRCL